MVAYSRWIGCECYSCRGPVFAAFHEDRGGKWWGGVLEGVVDCHGESNSLAPDEVVGTDLGCSD